MVSSQALTKSGTTIVATTAALKMGHHTNPETTERQYVTVLTPIRHRSMRAGRFGGGVEKLAQMDQSVLHK